MTHLKIFEFGFINLSITEDVVLISGEIPSNVFFFYFINELDFSSIKYTKLEFPKSYCVFEIVTTKDDLESFISSLELYDDTEINILASALKHLL